MLPKQFMMIWIFWGFLMASPLGFTVELMDEKGAFKSKLFEGKIYNDRGQYTGMITSEGKMYDPEGNFTGQIKNQSILNSDGTPKGYIRDGKIYNQDGLLQGQLKR